ncbi:enoyl-ACP reductase FabI [Oligella urethralis]|uniref:enoyl-ACP reductase FabI n=1 Tax=Oligella urethralis TaxID=90245 RepID=UPI000E07EB89|nr:enoyl-ACP reductase FabI [Oligella urethralis]SUA65407.1 Enoyl-[acyl-carrier-protein] reductase [NADH] FabI [Oligella urethralis]
MLKGKKGLVLGISNDNSIAWACARAMHEAGATLGGTWLNDKAKPYVEPLLQSLNAEIQLPLEVSNELQLEALFEEVSQRWGKLDFLLHSIAFAPKADLHGRVVDSSLEGFLQAMDISCHSFIRMARLAEPLMKDGGSLMTMSYLGGQEVVPNYSIMGPVKAALESTVRYLAYELGEQGIRVNAISPGTIMTRAASGIASFDALVEENARRAPMGAVDIDDVGPLSVFLASDGSRAITGGNIYVDGGFNILN